MCNEPSQVYCIKPEEFISIYRIAWIQKAMLEGVQLNLQRFFSLKMTNVERIQIQLKAGPTLNLAW